MAGRQENRKSPPSDSDGGALMPLLPYHIPGKPGSWEHCLHIDPDCIPGMLLPNSQFLPLIPNLSPHSAPHVLLWQVLLTQTCFSFSEDNAIVYNFTPILGHNHQSGCTLPKTGRSRWPVAEYLGVNGWDCPQKRVLLPSWRISSVAHGRRSFS